MSVRWPGECLKDETLTLFTPNFSSIGILYQISDPKRMNNNFITTISKLRKDFVPCSVLSVDFDSKSDEKGLQWRRRLEGKEAAGG